MNCRRLSRRWSPPGLWPTSSIAALLITAFRCATPSRVTFGLELMGAGFYFSAHRLDRSLRRLSYSRACNPWRRALELFRRLDHCQSAHRIFRGASVPRLFPRHARRWYWLLGGGHFVEVEGDESCVRLI